MLTLWGAFVVVIGHFFLIASASITNIIIRSVEREIAVLRTRDRYIYSLGPAVPQGESKDDSLGPSPPNGPESPERILSEKTLQVIQEAEQGSGIQDENGVLPREDASGSHVDETKESEG